MWVQYIRTAPEAAIQGLTCVSNDAYRIHQRWDSPIIWMKPKSCVVGKHLEKLGGGGDQKILCSSLFFGEMIQFDKHIFQMGWNHQVVFGFRKDLEVFGFESPSSKHPQVVFIVRANVDEALKVRHWSRSTQMVMASVLVQFGDMKGTVLVQLLNYLNPPRVWNLSPLTTKNRPRGWNLILLEGLGTCNW